MKKLVSGAIQLGLVVGFIFLIMSLQGKQEDKFQDEVHAQATASCEGDDACLANLDQNFGDCFEANHSSRRKGRYNREHTIDQAGFDTCLKLSGAMQGLAEAMARAAAGEGEDTGIDAGFMDDIDITGDDFAADSLSEMGDEFGDEDGNLEEAGEAMPGELVGEVADTIEEATTAVTEAAAEMQPEATAPANAEAGIPAAFDENAEGS